MVFSSVSGLSVRTFKTSTEPVIVSPGRTGALKFQEVHNARVVAKLLEGV